jgi:dTDP-4-amino-4,6-dideoxygalactose transaminase
MIPLFWPTYNGKKVQKAMSRLFPEDMSNRWLGQGSVVDEFEKKFGEKYNYKYCVSLNSGSSALELAYHLIGIKKGDEVIVPVLTCTATNIPLARMGAKIVFSDIDESLMMDWQDVRDKITKKTKAIVAVTLGGLPIDEEIFKIAKEHKIPVVIDAAQSVGVSETFGDYICYSFQAIKHFTTGDGGMLVLRNKKNYDRAKKLRWFGIDREAKIKNNWQPYKKREMTMDIQEPGFKFHMNDIAATLGLIALEDTDKWLEYRKQLGEYYHLNLNCRTIGGGAWWIFGLILNNRDKVVKELKRAGIETNMAHLRNDIFTVFGGKRQDLVLMNNYENKYLYIPLNLKVTRKDAEYIVKTINGLLE